MAFSQITYRIAFTKVALLWWFAGLGQGYFNYNNRFEEPGVLLEAGIAAGAINCITDLGGSRTLYQGPMAGFTFNRSRPTAGLYLTGTYKDAIAGRFELNYGMVNAADSMLKGVKSGTMKGRYDRNLSFRSPILEAGLGVEIHPLMFFTYLEREPPRLSPYFIASGGAFWFNPQANIDDRWVDLRPLRLEGQGFDEYPEREPYKKVAFFNGLGFGFRYDLSARLVLRFEWVKRTVSTDYLDDVHWGDWVDPNLFSKYLSPADAALARRLYNRSTAINLITPQNTRPRGHPDENDAYWSGVLKLGFNLNRSPASSGFPRSLRRGLKCPAY